MSRLFTLPALLLCLSVMAPAAEPPALEWKAGEASATPQDSRLKALDGKQFTLLARSNPGMEDGALVSWQSPDRKGGFRLFIKNAKSAPTLSFEAAFVWDNRRNNRPLELNAPLTFDRPHDVIVRFTGPNLELYVDGVLVDEEWPVGTMAPASAMPLVAGQNTAQLSLWNRAIDNVAELSGGAEKVAQRELELFGPEQEVTQYWKPRGFNTGVGDCMPFFHEGRFHLFYLIDRHGHGSKWGLGAHQWAHVSSTDLVKWTTHPLAIPISDQAEGSICTGSVFAHEGTFYGFNAVRTSDGSPARLAVSLSKDAIHFEKTDWSAILTAPYSGPPARDPVVFRDPGTSLFHMLVTTELIQPEVARHGGCLAHLVSPDLRNWEQKEPFLVPGYTDQPECADIFEWRGWYYLIFSNNGVARYRMSRQPLGPWVKPSVDAFDGAQLRVLKTAAFTRDRRLGAAFLTQASGGYAGQVVFRELIQRSDGTLGTGFPPELRPATGAAIPLHLESLTGTVSGDAAKVKIDATSSFGVAAFDKLPANYRLKVRVISPGPSLERIQRGAFGLCVRGSGRYEKGHELRFEKTKAGWRNTDTSSTDEKEEAALYNVDGLSRPFDLELIVKDDILDLCINGERTLVTRTAPSFSGDRLFLFAHNCGATFENLQIEPL